MRGGAGATNSRERRAAGVKVAEGDMVRITPERVGGRCERGSPAAVSSEVVDASRREGATV